MSIKIKGGRAFDKSCLVAVEKEYGIKIPASFADFLSTKSEGSIIDGGYFSFENPYCEYIKSASLYDLSSLDRNYYLSFSEFQTESDYGVPGLFLIGTCETSWFVCLDYREVKENPPVVILVPDQPDGYEDVPLLVNESFDDFWNNLAPDPNDGDE